MKHNMGTADRIIRGIAAVLLAYLILTGTVSGALAFILGIFAIALVATAVLAYCPPYTLLDIKTCRCDDHDEDKPAEA